MPAQRSATGILLIGAFKLLKALLLIAAGAGAIDLLHKDVALTVTHWIELLRVDPDNRMIHAGLVKILGVTPDQLKKLSVGTFIYAALLLTEGVGLLMRKHWAEYFTVVSTAGLIPLEVYELLARVSATKIAVLIVNVAIVVYLIQRLRSERR